MRTSSRLFFILLFVTTVFAGTAFLSVYPLASSAHAQGADNVFTGHVVAVTAGDTMDVRVGDDWTVTVRLHGVECPTGPRVLRETVTRYTSRLVLDTRVRVEVRGTASRSVVYGEVFPATGGESLNFMLARAGLATWASEYAAQRTDLEDAQAYARTAQRGLWGATDGSNITLPASVADAIQRKTAAAAARVKAAQARAEQSRRQTPKSAIPTPEPVPSRISTVSSPSPTPKPMPVKVAPPDAARYIPLIGGLAVGVLTFLALIAYGVAQGLPFHPRRLLCQSFFALTAGGLGAMAFVLPMAGWQKILPAGTVPTPVILSLVCPLVSVLLLYVGGGMIRLAARLRRVAVDPRRAEPGSVKLHGTARSATGEFVRSETGRIKGLYLREVTQRYTAETGSGKRLGSPRWVVVRDTASAVDLELFSSAGDGTGSALILAAQDGELPQSLAPARWIPYHVARFYNEVPSDTWFATAYEGDTRTEVFFVPNGATLTVWGGLYAPAPTVTTGETVFPVPRIGSDEAMGTLLLCDGPEARAYAAQGGASLSFGLGWIALGIVCGAGAFWGVREGGDIARQSATASLGIGLVILLFLAIAHGAKLARNAANEEREGETDPLRRPASAVWNRYQERFPGVLIGPVVGG
ncbi:MAG: hypothetical protein H8F28_04130 [Fibrella sp.]|nr:hypothetical protein [Armatimonadota bacterium]